MIVSTVIDSITYYSESHLKWVARQSWWDGFIAGTCITAGAGVVLFVVIMGR